MSRGLSAFVGRERELEVLERGLDKARSELCVIDVAAEPGLGKSRLIRDFFPKGTDFSTISSAEVAKVERLLNARPRKSLGFRSPQEVFHSLAYS